MKATFGEQPKPKRYKRMPNYLTSIAQIKKKSNADWFSENQFSDNMAILKGQGIYIISPVSKTPVINPNHTVNTFRNLPQKVQDQACLSDRANLKPI